jgi:hypothetical protein
MRHELIECAEFQSGTLVSDAHLTQTIHQARLRFEEMPCSPEFSVFKSVLILAPEISKDQADQIDSAQRAHRPEFVARGLMLGEFHEWSGMKGLHSDQFFPLRSPVPLLAIRTLVEQDLVFLIRPSDPAETRIKLISSYLEILGNSISSTRLAQAQAALADALQVATGSSRTYPSRKISGLRSRSPSAARLKPTAS